MNDIDKIRTARRSNQSVLKEITSEYSFIERTDAETETAILGHLMQKTDIGKDPDAGKN